MAVVTFPSRLPPTQDVLETLYRLTEALPAWDFELDQGEDDGRPSVCAEHRVTGVILSAHWGGNQWGVVTEGGALMSRSTDLFEALQRALA